MKARKGCEAMEHEVEELRFAGLGPEDVAGDA
jgi:hypothetical protein